MYETLRVGREPGVLRVVLDRPERRNSINGAVMAELHTALDEAERDRDCRVVVLEGRGGLFCTGMDFTEATRSVVAADDLAARGGELFFGLLERLTLTPRAVVANVDGLVAGGGVGIAAACDLVYATPRSSFSLPEALWGLLPCVVLPFLMRRTGFQPAAAMTLSTLPLSAEQAQRVRLVDEVADEPEALLRRLRLRLAKVDPGTVGDLKRYLRPLWPLSAEVQRHALDEFTRLMSSSAVRERIAGFVDHRALPWEGRR